MSTLYEKRGRRYYPIGETEIRMKPYYPAGCYTVLVRPGWETIWREVKPARPELLAALRELERELVDELSELNRIRPTNRETTPLERKAWQAYVDVMGDHMPVLYERPALTEVVEKVIERLQARIEGTEEERNAPF